MGDGQEEWAERRWCLGDQEGGCCSGSTQHCWIAFKEQGRTGDDGDLTWKNEGLNRSFQKFLLVSKRVGFGIR